MSFIALTLSQNPVSQYLAAMVASEELSNCFSQFKFLGLSTLIQARRSLLSFKQRRFYDASDSTSWKIFLKTLKKSPAPI